MKAHLATGRIGGDGGDVLNATDAHAGTGKSTESGLSTGAGGLGASTTGSTELDVESSDANLAAAGSDVLSSKHGRVRGRFVTVSLDLHTTYQKHALGNDLCSWLKFGAPVTREMVSLPERSVTWTKVSLKEA